MRIRKSRDGYQRKQEVRGQEGQVRSQTLLKGALAWLAGWR